KFSGNIFYEVENFNDFKPRYLKTFIQKYSDFKYYYLNIKGQKLEMTNEINKIILNQLKCYEDVLAKLN
ncbi:TPA: hypothetical protein ACHGQC_001785, partial [Campylobacter jejuni]